MNISRNHIVIATFYKFVSLENLRDIKEQIMYCCKNCKVKGTILIAHEGVNGTVAGSRESINRIISFLNQDSMFADMEHKESTCESMPFYRMKVKIKKEIVTMGLPGIKPEKKAGIRVRSEDWNHLIEDPEVLVIDTRNSYEHAIGTFKNAVSPDTSTFNEFPAFVEQKLMDYKNSKIAMFCTGGIRCEKATSYLLENGFSNVYHLQGGILKYLEDVSPEESLWQGECFVFDNRVSVGKNLETGIYEVCYGCRMPVSPDDKLSPMYEAGISCPRCFEKLSDEKRSRLGERQKQVELAEKRKLQHIGVPAEEQKLLHLKLQSV